MTTGQLIKSARKRAGMTQTELAGKLGIPYQSIGQWERDIRNPKFETLQRIASVLGVSVESLQLAKAYEDEPPQGSVHSFSENLRLHRKKQKLSQQELSNRTGIPIKTITAYERNSDDNPLYPTMDHLLRLSGSLGISIEALIGNSLTNEQWFDGYREDFHGRIVDALDRLNADGLFRVLIFLGKTLRDPANLYHPGLNSPKDALTEGKQPSDAAK